MSASIGSTDHLPTNPCPGPRRSFYTFLHDRTIKRFPRIAFPFARCHFRSAFFGNFDGTLGLMIPYSFGDPIAGFANPHNETRRDAPYLTVGHTPLSFGGFATSSRGAFAFRGHSASTSATQGTKAVGWRKLFLFFFFVHERRPRPRARPRPRPRPRRGGGGEGGGIGLDVRVEVRRTEGRPPPSP